MEDDWTFSSSAKLDNYYIFIKKKKTITILIFFWGRIDHMEILKHDKRLGIFGENGYIVKPYVACDIVVVCL